MPRDISVPVATEVRNVSCGEPFALSRAASNDMGRLTVPGVLILPVMLS